ncbi:hypothetical protein H6800_01190 [Candidatus Nomurabacteria bacterium]|nr:hypothetical protein [Candidatus Nomurabacteria bacterium]
MDYKTKKIMTKINNKKATIIIVIAVLLLLVGALAYYLFRSEDPTNDYKPLYETASDREADSSNDNKAKDDTSQSTTPSTSEEVPSSPSGSVRITQANQANGFINAKAEVSDFQVKTCVYQFTSEGARPVIRETQNQCEGISIPQAEFEKIGTYNLVVTAYSTGNKISSAPQAIMVRE